MMKFIRKYQWYFYVVVTTMVVISFSFFGTYGAVSNAAGRDVTAFHTIDGRPVPRSELEEMALFISTDSFDKLMTGPYLGANFLNDGVIQNSVIETGLGTVLIQQFPEIYRGDLETRLHREKRYTPYTHPELPFISAKGVWNYFAPSINSQLEYVQQSTNPLDPSVVKAKMGLYLAERRFPSYALSQMLHYQEKQYGKPDPNLNRVDLSLFGYRSLDDWFGPRFSRMVAEMIINSAVLAEQKGYRVSNEEAWADLLRNGQKSFHDLTTNGIVVAPSLNDYINGQLRRMGMDASKATKIWRQVLLFKRLEEDLKQSQLIDAQTLASLNQYSLEEVEGNQYQLPKPLQFSDFKNLEHFEIYLDQIAKRGSKGDLMIPKEFLSVSEIQRNAPELVQKRYLVEVSKTDLKKLQMQISLKETLDWELDENHFNQLKKEFADLGVSQSGALDQRIQALSNLDAPQRAKVDAYAMREIVLAHPEWLERGLEASKPETMTLSIRFKGGKAPLAGINNSQALMDLLDKESFVAKYSQDQDHYYRIRVLDRSSGPEALTFEEAEKAGVLAQLSKKVLEPYYLQIRETETGFKKDNGSWKEFSEVEEKVAQEYFKPLLSAIEKQNNQTSMIPDIAASLRFQYYANQVKSELEKKGSSPFVEAKKAPETNPQKLGSRPSLSQQFLFIEEPKTIARSSEEADLEQVFALKPGQWSPVSTPPHGDITFFQVKAAQIKNDPQQMFSQAAKLNDLIGNEAFLGYFKGVIQELKEKNAISFDYLNHKQEVSEAEIEPEKDV